MSDLKQRIEQVIASGIRNYCTGHYEDDDTALRQVYNDATGIAEYIVNDGFKNNGILSALQPDTDTIAEAICEANQDTTGQVWADLPQWHDYYRRMARAAVNAWMGE